MVGRLGQSPRAQDEEVGPGRQVKGTLARETVTWVRNFSVSSVKSFGEAK